MNGGIPNRDIDALGECWSVFPSVREALFKGNCRPGYSDAVLDTSRVKQAILEHAEFKAFAARVAAVFGGWRKAYEPTLKALDVNDLPKRLIHTLAEDALSRFAGLPLIDRYDVYQRLMDYWTNVMQDDVYLIAADGWVEAAKPRGIVEDKERKIKETPDLVIKRGKYKMDLVPPALVVARWFAKEHVAIEALQARHETAARELEESVEEHAGEEGLLADGVNEKGKVTRGGVKDRLKAIEDEPENEEERGALTRCLALIEAESEASKAVTEARAALDEKVLARYGKLSEAEIKTLVVEDKWLGSLKATIEGEVQRLTQQVAGRVKELEVRYAVPLPALEREVEAFGAKVQGHLMKIGLAW